MEKSSFEIHEVNKKLVFGLGNFTGSNAFLSSFSTQQEFLDLIMSIKEYIWQKFQMHYQIFNHRLILGSNQIDFILIQLMQAFQFNSNIANDYGLEFLLYLSQKRQITEAIDLAGYSLFESEQSSILFGEILFGNPENIENAQKYILTALENGNHAKFEYLPELQWEKFINQFGLTIKNVIYNLKGKGFVVSEELSSIKELKMIIPLEEIRNSIIEVYNRNNIEFQLNNLKSEGKR